MEPVILPATAIGLSLLLAVLGTVVCLATVALGLTYWANTQDAKDR